MHERKLELQAALAHVDAHWDDDRQRRGVERAQRALLARRRRRMVLSSVGAVAIVSIGWFAVVRGGVRPTQPVAAVSGRVPGVTSADARRIVLSDGSQILLLSAASRVDVQQDTQAQVLVELTHGAARFEVVPRAERVFHVRSADVSVQVLGTIFEVERGASQTHVRVLRGKVAVSWNGGRRELAVSEAGAFPPLPLAAANTQNSSHIDRDGSGAEPRTHHGAQPRRNVAARSARADAGRSTPAAHSANDAPSALDSAAAIGGERTRWRDTARRGEYSEAYAQLQQPDAAPASVEDLLLAADAARLSGHPEAALPYLRRVIDEHAQDARASLAAFTLGSLLMQQLARPREAEAAYARARALAVHPSLAQDALARQVEAASRAGDRAHAHALAEEYLARYPDGRRVRAVRELGGLDVK